MQKQAVYNNVLIGVTASGDPFLISPIESLLKLMDNNAMFEDNTQSLDRFPSKPGVYRCSIEFWFQQGYFEGYKADGESDWDFIPINVEEWKLDLGIENNELYS